MNFKHLPLIHQKKFVVAKDHAIPGTTANKFFKVNEYRSQEPGLNKNNLPMINNFVQSLSLKQAKENKGKGKKYSFIQSPYAGLIKDNLMVKKGKDNNGLLKSRKSSNGNMLMNKLKFATSKNPAQNQQGKTPIPLFPKIGQKNAHGNSSFKTDERKIEDPSLRANKYVYRGVDNYIQPLEAFTKGFFSRETLSDLEIEKEGFNKLLENHVRVGGAKHFVSTSLSKEVARKFALGNASDWKTEEKPIDGKIPYVYKINIENAENAFEVNKYLDLPDSFKQEEEIAIRNHIPAARIIKAKDILNHKIFYGPNYKRGDDDSDSDSEYEVVSKKSF